MITSNEKKNLENSWCENTPLFSLSGLQGRHRQLAAETRKLCSSTLSLWVFFSFLMCFLDCEPVLFSLCSAVQINLYCYRCYGLAFSIYMLWPLKGAFQEYHSIAVIRLREASLCLYNHAWSLLHKALYPPESLPAVLFTWLIKSNISTVFHQEH